MTGQTFSTIEMLTRLVAFDTTSRNSNLALIAFVRDYLAGHGVAVTLIHNEAKTKANLYATIGPQDKPGGIVLSGHTDVVPVDGQDWTGDPFTVEARDGRLFGRGTADMKGFIAAALAHVPQFVAARAETPIHLALSYDEEIGCVGVHGMVAHIGAHLPRPRLVLVGEPTGMKLVNAHKGIRSFVTQVTGSEAHSSNVHLGVNAVEVAARLIGFLGELRDEMRVRGDASGRFDPPYTSIHVGVIRGGTALNIIPRECRFHWEFRALPDQDEEAIIDRFNHFAREVVLPPLREISAEADIVTTPQAAVPPLVPLDDCPAEALVRALTGDNAPLAVAYGTEAGIFQRADIPAVICGPGSIDQAHKPDEFIALAELDACDRFLTKLAAHISTVT
ncbi:MAG TPA: acetylornithine deacetylase [Alphaproteobacteria bacterium]|nr:acetylornithine deacetylase [Alphaproteobacteria bacterium]HBC54740.1 acetylornithine deacetylase [Alphaproteobacteria bacterium]HCO89794.1 acetylornithine deacetylase [Alphaproteobacteria bacterium]